MKMKITDIIAEKRHGNALDDEAIRFWIDRLDAFADYQNSALLMAIAMGGMDARETLTLTDAMAHSGDMLDLSRYGDATVDKHSTGGVGDGTSFIVMPVMAAICSWVYGMVWRSKDPVSWDYLRGYCFRIPCDAGLSGWNCVWNGRLSCPPRGRRMDQKYRSSLYYQYLIDRRISNLQSGSRRLYQSAPRGGRKQ